MYRLLATADVHLSNTLPFAIRNPETLVTDRLMDGFGFLDQLFQYGRDNDIRTVHIYGDLLDRRLLDAIVAKMAASYFLLRVQEGFNIIVVPGNHEVYDADCRHYNVEMLRSVGVVVCNNSERFEHPHGPKFAAVPYLPLERAQAEIQNILEDGNSEETILLLHQTIAGGKVGKWTAKTDIGINTAPLALFRSTFSGHFHTPQVVVEGVQFLGAGWQHHFGDRGETRGFWDIEIPSKGEPKMDMVPSETPCFHEMDWESATEEMREKDYLRIHVHASPAQLKEKLQAAKEWAQSEKARLGLRFTKVVPHLITGTKSRLDISGEDARGLAGVRTWGRILPAYVDSCACDALGLDKERLNQLGAELLDEAEK